MSQSTQVVKKTAAQLYRDCLRMIRHTAGPNSPKSRELKAVIKREFLKNAAVKDEQKVEDLKFNAIRALSNYLIMHSAKKDPRFNKPVSS